MCPCGIVAQWQLGVVSGLGEIQEDRRHQPCTWMELHQRCAWFDRGNLWCFITRLCFISLHGRSRSLTGLCLVVGGIWRPCRGRAKHPASWFSSQCLTVVRVLTLGVWLDRMCPGPHVPAPFLDMFQTIICTSRASQRSAVPGACVAR